MDISAGATSGIDPDTIRRLKRLRALTARARVRLNAAWIAMSDCAREIAETPERHAAAPWRHVRAPAVRPAGASLVHFFYFSGSRSFDSVDSDHPWSLACGILGRGDTPVNLDLGERALVAQWHWEHCARRVNALVAAFESEIRKAAES